VFKFTTINVFPGKQLPTDQPLTDQLPLNQHPADQLLAHQSLTDQLTNSTEQFLPNQPQAKQSTDNCFSSTTGSQ